MRRTVFERDWYRFVVDYAALRERDDFPQISCYLEQHLAGAEARLRMYCEELSREKGYFWKVPNKSGSLIGDIASLQHFLVRLRDAGGVEIPYKVRRNVGITYRRLSLAIQAAEPTSEW